MKKNFRLFCFGFGQVAKYFVKNLIENNFNFDLITTNTTQTKQEEINGLTYKSYYFVDNKFDKDLLNDLNLSDKLLISVPRRTFLFLRAIIIRPSVPGISTNVSSMISHLLPSQSRSSSS